MSRLAHSNAIERAAVQNDDLIMASSVSALSAGDVFTDKFLESK